MVLMFARSQSALYDIIMELADGDLLHLPHLLVEGFKIQQVQQVLPAADVA
jgi:hypothetical protein